MTNRIKELRRARGLTQDGLGRLIGTGRSQIVKLERGERRLTVEWMRRLARALECHPADLLAMEGPTGHQPSPVAAERPAAQSSQPSGLQEHPVRGTSPGPPPAALADRDREPVVSALEVPPPGSLLRDVEVRGLAVGGQEGCFEFNGEVVDRVRRPPGISNAPGVFAIYVVGHSMSPRFEEGELVFVHPGRPATSGCDVIVELHGRNGDPGQCYIKRLVKRTATRTILQQFNPARDDIAFDNDNIRSLYRILTASELLGV